MLYAEFTYVQSLFFLLVEAVVTSLLPSLFSPWLCDPFLQVISPGLEKTINPIKSKRGREGNKKGRFEWKSLQKLLGVAGEEKKEQSRGPAYISLSSNSFMSSKLFQRPELLCLCCALKSLAGLYEEKQREHFRKSYKGNGRAEEERKSEWHHW